MSHTGRSTASLLTEAIVIVVSILLAFGLDAAWDYSRDRKEEAELQASLVREFSANRQIIEERISGATLGRLRIEALDSLTPSQVGSLPSDTAWSHFQALWRPYTVELSSGVLTSAESSGTLSLLRDDALRESIAGWRGRTDDLREAATINIRQAEVVTRELDRVAASLATGLLFPSKTPELLRAIRSDEVAMASVARRHYQLGVYVFELRALMARLDSTLLLLNAP